MHIFTGQKLRSFLTPEDPGSNPVISFFSIHLFILTVLTNILKPFGHFKGALYAFGQIFIAENWPILSKNILAIWSYWFQLPQSIGSQASKMTLFQPYNYVFENESWKKVFIIFSLRGGRALSKSAFRFSIVLFAPDRFERKKPFLDVDQSFRWKSVRKRGK